MPLEAFKRKLGAAALAFWVWQRAIEPRCDAAGAEVRHPGLERLGQLGEVLVRRHTRRTAPRPRLPEREQV